jgi:hypothetical protein
MVYGSDFELGTLKIKGIESDQAISAASEMLGKGKIEESGAIGITYDPSTKEIKFNTSDSYVNAEAFDAVPLIDRNDPEQRRRAVEFRMALLDAICSNDDVYESLKLDLTNQRHFMERVARGAFRISDLSAQDVFKHTMYRYIMLVPKIMFIIYYRTKPEFREFIYKKLEEDPMYPLFSYNSIHEWMSFAEGRDVRAPLKMARVVLGIRDMMARMWEGINREMGLNADIVSPTYIGWLMPPAVQSGIVKLLKDGLREYQDIVRRIIGDVKLRDVYLDIE